MDDTLQKVAGIIRDLFDEYDGPITRELTAANVPQWDSLGHVQLMVAVEQLMGIRFKSDEIRSFASLGDLIDAIDRKKVAT
jgi:acyl carrier protein